MVCIILISSICNVTAYSEVIVVKENSVHYPSVNYAEVTGVYENVTQCNLTVDILVQFVNSKDSKRLQNNFFTFILSLLSRTTCKINLYITCDTDGEILIEKLFQTLEIEFDWLVKPNIIYLDVDELSRQLIHVIKPMQVYFMK